MSDLKKIRYIFEYDSIRVLVSTLIVIIITSIMSKYFLTLNNFSDIFRGQSIIGIMVVGQLFVIICAGIDISVGSLFGLSGAIAAVMLQAGMPVFYAIAVPIAVGVLVGFINGFLIAKLKIVPFIVTLGMMGILRGMSFILTNSQSISIENEIFNAIDSSSIFLIPFPFIILFIIAFIMNMFLKHTKTGLRIYAVGDDPDSAKMLGIRTGNITMISYIICSTLAAVGGIIGASKVSSSYPLAGTGYEFEVIAAVLIGGALMTGGKGTIISSILGAFFIGILKNAIIQVGISQYWQQAASGMAIILVIMFSTMMSKRRT